MKIFNIVLLIIIVSLIYAQDKKMKYNPLSPQEEQVIINKGTEQPFSGIYEHHSEKGNYICKRCDAPLYSSDDKFDARCGWPSFDDEIPGAIRRETDADGKRTEILCANCGAHLGHVFAGEGFTDKNIRHCVNSISLNFESHKDQKMETAIFAGGCFWGVEFYYEKEDGVKSAVSGYIGGRTKNPSYQDVCSGTTGHIEAVKVTYDPQKISYEALAKLFFEIHDPTQRGGQGPDIGQQYESAIFYQNDDQKNISEKLISILKEKGLNVVTSLIPATTFWDAEAYHQNYYDNKGGTPYCHFRTKRF